MDNKYEDDIFNVQDRLKTLNEAAGPASSKDNKRGWTLLPAWIFIAAVAVIVLAVIMNTKIRAAVSLKSARKNAADQNYEQAITDYEKVVRLDQSNTAAYFELQKVYIETGDIENADKISYRACIPINEEFFPDDNFRAYIQEAFDPEKRGKLYSRERIDRLDVSCKQIRSLKGIEYFSKVTTLTCDYNQLTSLDLSKNSALSWLYCSRNQLKELNITQNTELRYLDCYDNQLTNLDVSKNKLLSSLDCSNNQLTELDLSNNAELNSVHCDNNNLTSLDLDENAELQSLSCSYNPLDSLDLSKCTKLLRIFCSFDQLTSIDLSNNTELEFIDILGNQIKSLDVSHCKDDIEINGGSEAEIIR